MSARNRVFMILGLLTLGSLIWYLVTARPSGDLHLIGTVDANEVEVSSKIPGRIQTLTVEEGQDVKAGDLIAVIESDDLAAAHKAAAGDSLQPAGQAQRDRSRRSGRRAAKLPSQTINAEAQVRAAQGGAGAGAGKPGAPAGRNTPHRGAGQAGNHERAGQRRGCRQPARRTRPPSKPRSRTSPPRKRRCKQAQGPRTAGCRRGAHRGLDPRTGAERESSVGPGRSRAGLLARCLRR